MTALAPGSIIGIIGGGQLGRMSAVSAAELGYLVHIFTPEDNSPAAQVAAFTTVAAYDDQDALDAFAKSVHAVTFEFENIPTEAVAHMAAFAPVRPKATCLGICQDRVAEKSFCNQSGIKTAPWRAVNCLDDLKAAVADIGAPAILKTNRLGYDGKGQVRIKADTDLTAAWAEMNAAEAVLEGFVDFDLEVSVITARRENGDMASYDVVQNIHKDGILDVTLAPATIADDVAARATEIAQKLTQSMDLVGLLAVEMFVTSTGEIIVNEMAPRPHNSGHWTQDGAVTSQFEQFIRAVADLPLGDASRHSDAAMKNLLGDEAHAWESILAKPENKLHLYGKAEARAGRKMGHVNRLSPKGSGAKVPEI